MSYSSGDLPTRDAKLEDRLRQTAATFAYPQTPDLPVSIRQRLTNREHARPSYRPGRLAFGAVLLLIVLVVGLLVSPVRARVLDWIRLGAVRIFLTQPSPTPTTSGGTPSPVVTVTPTALQSVLDLAGETSLADAQERAGFTILLPAYPPDLGPPDHVYLQTLNGPIVVLVWLDEDQPAQVRMSLSETETDKVVFHKYEPRSVEDTQVNDQAAVWLDGDYILVTLDGDVSLTRLIHQGHTLIWNSGEMTFRLETDADFATAIRIAESIR